MEKDFKYILKRVIIGVIIGFILFNFKSCSVKAYTNSIIGNNVELPLSGATFISMNSSSTWSNVGYRYFHGSTLNPDLYLASPTTNNLTCGTYGCGISIDSLSVVANNYYSITIYLLGTNTPYWHYSYSGVTQKVGVSNGFSTINANNWVTPVSGTTSLNRKCDSLYDNEYTGNCIFTWTIIFKAPITGSSVQTWWSSNPSGADPQNNGFLVGYEFKYVGDNSMTPEQLNSALNNVVSDINSNSNTNTNLIIGSISDLADDILTGQNQNTQDIIDSEKSCLLIDSTFCNVNAYLNSNGTQVSSSNNCITDYININGGELSIVNYRTSNDYYCFYNNNKALISCTNYNGVLGNITIPNNAYYFRTTIYKSSNAPRYKLCKNGNQFISEQQQETNQQLNDLNNNLTDETGPNTSALNNSAGWLPPGPVDSILNLPISLLNNISDNLSNSCQPVVLTIPLVNSNLTIPCVNTLYEQMGVTSWLNTIGAIASAFILFSYMLKLYKWVDDTLTFRENNHIDNWGGV